MYGIQFKAPKANPNDPFEDMLHKKYLSIMKVFNKYNFKLVPRNMQFHITMLLVSIFMYLRLDDIEECYKSELDKMDDVDKAIFEKEGGIKSIFRQAIISAVVDLYEAFPIKKNSQVLSFHLDHVEPEKIDPDKIDEMVFPKDLEPLKDSFGFKINIHGKGKSDQSVGVAYSRQYGLESDEFFIEDNLKDFAMFLFIMTTSNAFSRRIVNVKSIKRTSLYDNRFKTLFGDLDVPLPPLPSNFGGVVLKEDL